MPRIEARAVQAYVGKRVIIRMGDLAARLPALMSEVYGRLKGHGIKAAGKPFLRYRVIDMPDRMDIELGIPVDGLPSVDGGPAGDTLPAGRYASSTFTGIRNAVSANRELIEWIAAQGEEMDAYRSDLGEVFGARHETTLTDTEANPDQDQWETQIAIRLRD